MLLTIYWLIDLINLLDIDDLEKLLVGASVLKEPLILKDFSDAELIDPEVAT